MRFRPFSYKEDSSDENETNAKVIIICQIDKFQRASRKKLLWHVLMAVQNVIFGNFQCVYDYNLVLYRHSAMIQLVSCIKSYVGR